MSFDGPYDQRSDVALERCKEPNEKRSVQPFRAASEPTSVVQASLVTAGLGGVRPSSVSMLPVFGLLTTIMTPWAEATTLSVAAFQFVV